MLYLLINDQCGDDENDGNGELQHYQSFSDDSGAPCLEPKALQNQCGIEGRQIKSGITAGHQAAHQGYQQQCYQVSGVAQVQYQ